MKPADTLIWIAEIFEEPKENITPETPRDTIPGWDSMGTLALMAALDKDFDVLLGAEDIQKFTKVGDILQVLRQNGKLDAE